LDFFRMLLDTLEILWKKFLARRIQAILREHCNQLLYVLIIISKMLRLKQKPPLPRISLLSLSPKKKRNVHFQRYFNFVMVNTTGKPHLKKSSKVTMTENFLITV
jgi:hypothetical protein